MGQVPGRVGDRAVLRALRRPAGRARRGPIQVSFVPVPAGDGGGSAQVAYAVNRACGSAVQRNRLRRRCRAAVREAAGAVPAGGYLIRPEPAAAALAYPALALAVRTAMVAAADQGSPGAGARSGAR